MRSEGSEECDMENDSRARPQRLGPMQERMESHGTFCGPTSI
jgi:hypothetical protein